MSGITLDFAADSAGGNGTVSTYTAGYTSDPSRTLTFSDIASTAMPGGESGGFGAMEAEDDYLAALKTVTGYSISGGVLTLFGGPYQNMNFSFVGRSRGTTSSSER